MRPVVTVLVLVGVVVPGCGQSKPPRQLVRVPDVVGLAADRGIERVHAAGLCPRPRLADTIGSPPYSTVAAVTPVAGGQVPEGSIVTVDVAPSSAGADIFEFQGC
jgi:hypothetical protein